MSCKKPDMLRDFGKAPRDVNSIPSKILNPVGKLVFYAYADESKGTRRPVWMSDSVLAARAGVSRAAVIPAKLRLAELGLIEKVGAPTKEKQVQGYRITHHLFSEKAQASQEILTAKQPRRFTLCSECGKLRPSVTKAGWCRSCNAVKNTERIARRVAREEITAEKTA